MKSKIILGLASGLAAVAVGAVLVVARATTAALPLATVTPPTDTPALGPTETPTPVITMFGALSNFDVFNDTGQECHGFEIELDGVTSQDVLFTFGDPYERYGNPKVVDFAGGVYVRYESPYDSVKQMFTQTTPLAPSVITPTGGHACWTGGSADYLTSGCEHFGVGINGNPTATVYRWLVADPANPGALQPSGTKVSIPAPVWSVATPTPGAVNPAPVVAAVIRPEPPEPGFQFGDAIWVKVFKTESADPAELHHLVTDDPRVPQDQSETETEWMLLQAGGKGRDQLENEGQIGEGNESVTRRYEFYEYTGAYDAESHEALPVNDSNPDAGDIGNYIGAQMAALNLPPVGPTPTPTVGACIGDCDSSGSVTVDELVTAAHIALGNQALAACTALDCNADGVVTVDCVLKAVNAALTSCH